MAATGSKVEAAPSGEMEVDADVKAGAQVLCASCGVELTPDEMKKCTDTCCKLMVCDTHRNAFHHARRALNDKAAWKKLMDGPEEDLGEFLVDYEGQCPSKGRGVPRGLYDWTRASETKAHAAEKMYGITYDLKLFDDYVDFWHSQKGPLAHTVAQAQSMFYLFLCCTLGVCLISLVLLF